jgi:hypothetical protein
MTGLCDNEQNGIFLIFSITQAGKRCIRIQVYDKKREREREREKDINYFSQLQDDCSCSPPQQEPASPPQLHSPLSISFPLRAALIIAQAHPTPLWTSIA